MYTIEDMAKTEELLGKKYAARSQSEREDGVCEERIVHQGVATMGHLRHVFGWDVEMRSWGWLQQQIRLLREEEKRSANGRWLNTRSMYKTRSQRKRVHKHEIFSAKAQVPCTISIWPYDDDLSPSTVDMYTTMTARSDLFRGFPPQTEIAWEISKIGDIQALNEIAASSPLQYAYRPRTCLDHGKARHDMKNCCLAGLDQIVMKRSHSSCGAHVDLIDGDRAGVKQRNERDKGFVWFGQKFQPSFADFGEFRVFIVAKRNVDEDRMDVVRGRCGDVVHTIITEWPQGNDTPGEMYVHAATAHDFRSPHVQPLDASDLHAFALHVFSSLRRRSDWKTHFESLEVGVRLDIGITTESKKRCKAEKKFFVNEISRFYCADYFSQQTLGAPCQEICYTFAESINTYLSEGRDVN